MQGEASALGASFFWALTSVLVQSQSRRLGAIALTGLLCGFASAFYLILLFLTGKAVELWNIALFLLLILLVATLVGRILGDVLWVKSIQLVGVSRCLPVSTSSYPLFTLLLAFLLLGEPVTPLLILGILLVAGGIGLLARSGAQAGDNPSPAPWASIRIGVSLAALAGLFWAVETTLLKRGLEDLHPITVSMVQFPVAAIVLLFLAQRQQGGVGLKRCGWEGTAAIAGAALLGLGVGSLLFLFALTWTGTATVAVLTSTSPLFALPLSVLFLKERVTRRVVAGTLLCLAGIVAIVQ